MAEQLYLIGEFAKILSVKKQTLLWYDQIDLFKPEQISPSGYRYYDLNQVDLFNVIRNLQKLGIPLADLQNLLAKRQPQTMRALLKAQAPKIEQERNQLENLAASLASWIDSIDQAEQTPLNAVYLEESPAEPILRSQDCRPLSPAARTQEITRLNQYRVATLNMQSSIGGMVALDDVAQTKTNYAYYYTHANPNDANALKPAGTFICLYFKGNYTDSHQVYQKLLGYAQDHQLELADYTYEQSQISEIMTASPEDYITKISIPLKK